MVTAGASTRRWSRSAPRSPLSSHSSLLSVCVQNDVSRRAQRWLQQSQLLQQLSRTYCCSVLTCGRLQVWASADGGYTW